MVLGAVGRGGGSFRQPRPPPPAYVFSHPAITSPFSRLLRSPRPAASSKMSHAFPDLGFLTANSRYIGCLPSVPSLPATMSVALILFCYQIPILTAAGCKIQDCGGRRCLKCPWSNGFPLATQRIVISDAAWGLSLGKILELSFSIHATARRVACCGHALHMDCLGFYG